MEQIEFRIYQGRADFTLDLTADTITVSITYKGRFSKCKDYIPPYKKRSLTEELKDHHVPNEKQLSVAVSDIFTKALNGLNIPEKTSLLTVKQFQKLVTDSYYTFIRDRGGNFIYAE